MPTINHLIDLHTEECCTCYVMFAMPAEMKRRRREDGNWFYCPNGHQQHYSESDNKVLRQQLEEAQRKLSASKCETASERVKREAVENDLSKLKRRAHGGVCPCCKRTFQNVRRHMATKHPELTQTLCQTKT